MGLEVCMMLGMLSEFQVQCFVNVGLDYYNYNLDILLEFYGNIIIICIYQECFDMLEKVCDVGIKVCFGGIVGLGEMVKDCVGLLL